MRRAFRIFWEWNRAQQKKRWGVKYPVAQVYDVRRIVMQGICPPLFECDMCVQTEVSLEADTKGKRVEYLRLLLDRFIANLLSKIYVASAKGEGHKQQNNNTLSRY